MKPKSKMIAFARPAVSRPCPGRRKLAGQLRLGAGPLRTSPTT